MATALISAIASLPLLFAAVIFGILFAAAPDVRYAMSSNLLGTLVGGLIECVSFITGLGIIGLFAVVFYLLAGVFILRRERAPD